MRLLHAGILMSRGRLAAARMPQAEPTKRRCARCCRATCAAAPATRPSSRPSSMSPRPARAARARGPAMLDLGRTLLQSVERSPRPHGLSSTANALTYRQWARTVGAVQRGLAAAGLRAGDHLLVVLQNRWEMAALHWACQFAGIVDDAAQLARQGRRDRLLPGRQRSARDRLGSRWRTPRWPRPRRRAGAAHRRGEVDGARCSSRTGWPQPPSPRPGRAPKTCR
jgi:hypothetical protein